LASSGVEGGAVCAITSNNGEVMQAIRRGKVLHVAEDHVAGLRIEAYPAEGISHPDLIRDEELRIIAVGRFRPNGVAVCIAMFYPVSIPGRSLAEMFDGR
jgi:hypothetical protein